MAKEMRKNPAAEQEAWFPTAPGSPKKEGTENGIKKRAMEEIRSAVLRPSNMRCCIFRLALLNVMYMTQDEPTMERKLEVHPRTTIGMYWASPKTDGPSTVVVEMNITRLSPTSMHYAMKRLGSVVRINKLAAAVFGVS